MQGVDPSEWGVGAMAGGLDEAVPVLEGEGTARLALVDMDWEHVKAVDILMVLRSFLAEVQSPPRSPLHGEPCGVATSQARQPSMAGAMALAHILQARCMA